MHDSGLHNSGLHNSDLHNSGLSDLLRWTTAAELVLKKVPFFARPQARLRVEQLAREQGADTVTVELVEQARQEFGQ
jgi:hypothetical protein